VGQKKDASEARQAGWQQVKLSISAAVSEHNNDPEAN
jgi:hypothetical protein